MPTVVSAIINASAPLGPETSAFKLNTVENVCELFAGMVFTGRTVAGIAVALINVLLDL